MHRVARRNVVLSHLVILRLDEDGVQGELGAMIMPAAALSDQFRESGEDRGPAYLASMGDAMIFFEERSFTVAPS